MAHEMDFADYSDAVKWSNAHAGRVVAIAKDSMAYAMGLRWRVHYKSD